MPAASDPLAELVARVPEGWSTATYDGRRYAVTRTSRAGGRAVSVFAEELGGTDVISTNVYLPDAGPELRPCEMPAEKVLAFLASADFSHPGTEPGTEPEAQLRPET